MMMMMMVMVIMMMICRSVGTCSTNVMGKMRLTPRRIIRSSHIDADADAEDEYEDAGEDDVEDDGEDDSQVAAILKQLERSVGGWDSSNCPVVRFYKERLVSADY